MGGEKGSPLESAREPLLGGAQAQPASTPPPSTPPPLTHAYSSFTHGASPTVFTFPLPPANVSTPPERKWRGGLLECCGECSDTDVTSCALSTLLPCVAWASNQSRAFALSFASQLLLYLLLAYLLRFAAISLISGCALEERAQRREHGRGGYDPAFDATCRAASAAVSAWWWLFTCAFSLYAAHRRGLLRSKFGISGGVLGDFFAWLFCPACALCQESRTLAHARVEEGIWVGPASPDSSPNFSPAPPYFPPPPQPPMGAAATTTQHVVGFFVQPPAPQPAAPAGGGFFVTNSDAV